MLYLISQVKIMALIVNDNEVLNSNMYGEC